MDAAKIVADELNRGRYTNVLKYFFDKPDAYEQAFTDSEDDLSDDESGMIRLNNIPNLQLSEDEDEEECIGLASDELDPSGGKKLTPVAPETPATTTESGGALASSTSHDASYVFSGASQSDEHVVTVGPSRPVELLTDSVCDLGTDEPQQYTLRKDHHLAEITKSIPRNATYTSHDVQNEVIEMMSAILTEEIVREIGDSWYTIKVDGTRDPTVESSRAFGADVRIEAVGLLRAVTQLSFKFIANLIRRVLALLEPPNRMLQAENMDLYTAVTLVNSASECIGQLRNETAFCALWNTSVPAANDDATTTTGPSKRKRVLNQNLRDFVVEESVGQNKTNEKFELERLFYSVVDAVHGELCARFGERNSHLIGALAALDPEADRENFMDTVRVKPLLELTGTELVESEYIVGRQFLYNKLCESELPPDDGKWTLSNMLTKFSGALQAMPSVLTAMTNAVTLGASTAMCENSFSTLKNIYSEHRRSMLHKRKAHLIQLAFEKDLTRRFRNEWKEKLMRRFHSQKRRLQLY
ncbi:unnamed protein product [Leuciscus chuanchicus]